MWESDNQMAALDRDESIGRKSSYYSNQGVGYRGLAVGGCFEIREIHVCYTVKGKLIELSGGVDVKNKMKFCNPGDKKLISVSDKHNEVWSGSWMGSAWERR